MFSTKFLKVTVLLFWRSISYASQLSVVTYNVWFDSATAEQRVPKILDVVAAKNADIIAFQEVESWFIDALEADDRFKPYHFAAERGWFNSVKGGLLVLVKTELLQQHYLALPSNMDRGLLQLETEIEGVRLCVATVHLDSMLDDSKLRIRQLEAVSKQTSQCNDLILLGDFNFGDGEVENNKINPGYRDAWKQLKPNDRGYTWNVIESNLARQNSFPSEGSRRLDKVYVMGGALIAHHAEIIANTAFTSPTGQRLLPSDHFGLFVVFKIDKESQAEQY